MISYDDCKHINPSNAEGSSEISSAILRKKAIQIIVMDAYVPEACDYR